ncbi:hypothetical protein A3756_23800 [Oleiphilus sp. HI0086]|nr:hypothetical protein A3756_23800 [Oleiphilus sp. HI0086]
MHFDPDISGSVNIKLIRSEQDLPILGHHPMSSTSKVFPDFFAINVRHAIDKNYLIRGCEMYLDSLSQVSNFLLFFT